MEKLTQLKSYLNIIPTVVLSIALILVSNGITLEGNMVYETLVGICVALSAAGVIAKPTVPDAATQNNQEDDKQ